jgi:hypothetical protein
VRNLFSHNAISWHLYRTECGFRPAQTEIKPTDFVETLISSSFPKSKRRLMLSSACVSVCPSYQLPNAWTNLHENWYIHHDTWTLLKGLLHKSVSTELSLIYVQLILHNQYTSATVLNCCKWTGSTNEFQGQPTLRRSMQLLTCWRDR